jgi:hypothetical protein
VVCLLILGISFLAYYARNIFFLHKEAYSTEEYSYESKNESAFLSDEYFDEIDTLYAKIKKENGQWYILDDSKQKAANAVINKMMEDLENNRDILSNHKNGKRFFETFDKYIRRMDSITERMHYFRNTLNLYSGAPVELKSMIDMAAEDEWYLFSGKFHRFYYGEINGALNVKFLSADGRFEAVYNTETGGIVTDPANMGTYNYAPGSINPIKFYYHDVYDKRPWKKWGNVKGFSYQKVMNLKSGHGTDEANSNEKAVKRRIAQRKKELQNGFAGVG